MPLTRSDSGEPGTRNNMPIAGVSSRFVRVSARRLPGRSGTTSVWSSRMRTKPASSPWGLTSHRPSRSTVPTQTYGDASMNRRRSASSAGLTFSRVIGAAAPTCRRRRSSDSTRHSLCLDIACNRDRVLRSPRVEIAKGDTMSDTMQGPGGPPDEMAIPWIDVTMQQQVAWRDGDIVISVPVKSGTTWMMNIVHQLRSRGRRRLRRRLRRGPVARVRPEPRCGA